MKISRLHFVALNLALAAALLPSAGAAQLSESAIWAAYAPSQ